MSEPLFQDSAEAAYSRVCHLHQKLMSLLVMLSKEREEARSRSRSFQSPTKIDELSDHIVELNVGGQLFATSHSTLTKYPNTFLEAIFSGRHANLLTDKEGRIFIDRSPMYFGVILDWLRTDQPPDPVFYDARHSLHKGLVHELQYYGLLDVFPFDPSSFQLEVGAVCAEANAENTSSSLLDGDYCTGAVADPKNPTIVAIFPSRFSFSGASIAGYFKNTSKWPATNGSFSMLEYFDHEAAAWKPVGNVPGDFGQVKQLFHLHWDPPRLSSRWRVRGPPNGNGIGLSQLCFHV